MTYKVVQKTPEYNLSRPEVPSGARLTLFANFLGAQQGIVVLDHSGTSIQCEVHEWKANSVTMTLPRLGLLGPKSADIRIVLPSGRVAKCFPVLFASPPDLVVHDETVPVPMPPAPASERATYAVPVAGGLVLQTTP